MAHESSDQPMENQSASTQERGSDTATDGPVQGFLETLLETPSLQETLADIINKGRGSEWCVYTITHSVDRRTCFSEDHAMTVEDTNEDSSKVLALLKHAPFFDLFSYSSYPVMLWLVL